MKKGPELFRIRSGVMWCLLLTVSMGWLYLWACQASSSGWCIDEAAHIPAGLYHLETGQMDAYRVNPPLPRMIAALPLLLDRPVIEWQRFDSPLERAEFRYAHRWVADNQPQLPTYLFRTRSTLLLFFALGLWSIVCWTRDLYGNAAAAVAALMWGLNPDVLTYASVVAPDLPAASAGLLVGYLFWRWLRSSPRPFPWTLAAAVALAILCKFSWLFLLPILPLVVLANDWIVRRRRVASDVGSDGKTRAAKGDERAVGRDAMRLAASFCLTLAMINWAYGFEGTGTKLGDFQFVSQVPGDPDSPPGQVGNRFSGSLLAQIPVLLPKQMVLGLDFLKYEFETGLPCYLRGTWQDRGWWYFYLYAMAVKMPLGYWMLIAVGIVSMIWDWKSRRVRASKEWIPLCIACLFVALISSQTGFTHHVRYILPAYGFLFILASRVMVVLPASTARGLAVVCLTGVFVFHATHAGLAHTFFNPMSGGPNEGWRHLARSNVDWGQSIYRMVQWVKEHPEQRPMTVLFNSNYGNPQQLVSDFEQVTTQTEWRKRDDHLTAVPAQSGWYLISSRQMTLQKNQYFWDKQPVSQPYPDVLLFHLAPQD